MDDPYALAVSDSAWMTKLRANISVTSDGHWMWHGAMHGGRYPQAQAKFDKRTIAVARLLMLADGAALPPLIRRNCDAARCVAPHHWGPVRGSAVKRGGAAAASVSLRKRIEEARDVAAAFDDAAEMQSHKFRAAHNDERSELCDALSEVIRSARRFRKVVLNDTTYSGRSNDSPHRQFLPATARRTASGEDGGPLG